MRTSGLGLSILLIAAGAILAWAVDIETEGVDLQMIGLILFVVGIVGAIITLAIGAANQRTVIERDREVVVDRNESDVR